MMNHCAKSWFGKSTSNSAKTTAYGYSIRRPFPNRGISRVGVARQWCGRLGKVDNAQAAIYMGYVSAKEHALVDMRLYMPKEWTKDKKRREKAGAKRPARKGRRAEERALSHATSIVFRDAR